MKFLFILSTLLLVSCAGSTGGDSVAPILPETASQFVGDASNDSRLVGVNLDLTPVSLNIEVAVDSILGCGDTSIYTYGSSNATDDKGIEEGSFIIESSDNGKTGVIRFGHLAYADITEHNNNIPFSSMVNKHEVCALFSGESFDFEVDSAGNLHLYAIAPGKAWDGSESIFLKNP